MTQAQPTATARLVRHACAAVVASSLFLVGCSDSPEALLAKAQESIEKNEPKAAEIHLKNLLLQADDPEARFLLGSLYLRAFDLPSAEKEFRRAQDKGFDASRLVLPLSRTLLLMGEPEKAIDEASKGIPASATDQAKLAVVVGQAQASLGQRDAARASFERALSLDPSHVSASVGLISLQAGTGDLKGASAAIDEVLAKSPNDASALSLKGDLDLVQGRREAARAAYEKAAAADPTNRQLAGKIAAVAMDLGDFEGAQKAIDTQRRLTGASAQTAYLQGLLHARQGKLAEARQSVEQALKANPGFLPAQALGAQVYLELGANEQALHLARQVADAAPDSTRGYLLLATAQMRVGNPAQALRTLESVIGRGARDPNVFALAGEAALRSNDNTKSASYFSEAIQLDPEDPRKQTGLALAQLAGGDRERGLTELERLSRLDTAYQQADLALISAHLRARQYDKALEAIDRLEAKQPDSPMAAQLRGAALQGKGDDAGARKALALALERDPKFFPAVSSLARLDLAAKQPDAAKKRFSDFLAIEPKSVAAMVALAELIEGTAPKGDAKASAEALALLKKARETDKTSIPANIALGSWLVRNDRAREAIPQLQEAVNANPGNIQLLDALGTAYLRTDQDNLGMETLERILQARPENPMLQLRMGQLKLSRNDPTGALVNFRKAAELQPKAIEPRMAIATASVRAGRPDDARRIANALQTEAPKNPAGFVLKGDLALGDRKYEEAAAEYRKALALQNTPSIEVKLHQAISRSGNLAEADRMLGSMLKQRPDDLVLLAYAGEQEIGRKRWDKAIAYYEQVLAKQPENALILNNTAWAMYEAKNPKALQTAEKALAAAPEAPAVLDTVGVILMQAGETERALELLRKAVAGAPKASSIRLHLAEALAKSGDKTGARSEIEKLLLDQPQGEIAEQARELSKQL